MNHAMKISILFFTLVLACVFFAGCSNSSPASGTETPAPTTVATVADCPVPGEDGLTVDLYTVIGYPSARYVRIAVTRLGETSAGEPGVRRLQFSRIQLLRP